MKNLSNMMKQAQELQTKVAEVQEKMQTLEVIGVAAAGMCEVTMSGKGQALKLKIAPSLLVEEDSKILEDLIVAAFNDAKSKADALMRDEMSNLTGGLPIPSWLQLPL